MGNLISTPMFGIMISLIAFEIGVLYIKKQSLLFLILYLQVLFW